MVFVFLYKQESLFNMETLEKRLINTLKIEVDKYKNNSVLKDFEEASKLFDKLVEKGLAKKRGNNLLSKDDFHLKKTSFNTAL